MLFFFSFERLTWEGHWFLYPRIFFLPMFSCNKVFFCISLALVWCFFFLYFRRIILIIIIIRFSIVFSLSIRNRYTIGINNRLFINRGIIRIVSLFMLLLLLLLRRVVNIFFLHLRILLDSL